MKICDKCKNKSKDAKDFGVTHKVVFEEEKIDLCQECFFESYKMITGRDYLDDIHKRGEY